MSVMLSYAIFPTDKGSSVSEYVSNVIKMVSQCGFPYKLTPMSTIVETETMDEALEVINQSYKLLEPFCDRLYLSLTMDIKKGEMKRMEQKIHSIESKIGPVSK